MLEKDRPAVGMTWRNPARPDDPPIVIDPERDAHELLIARITTLVLVVLSIVIVATAGFWLIEAVPWDFPLPGA